MKTFLQMVAGLVFGVLSGYDRLMFRGHLRELSYPGGMHRYVNFNGVKLTEFKAHAERVTAELLAASLAEAKRSGRPIEYLRSPKLRKEDRARAIATRDGVRDGLIAVFTCVEPCSSFALRGNGGSKKLGPAQESAENASLSGHRSWPPHPQRSPRRPPCLDRQTHRPRRLEFIATDQETKH